MRQNPITIIQILFYSAQRGERERGRGTREIFSSLQSTSSSFRHSTFRRCSMILLMWTKLNKKQEIFKKFQHPTYYDLRFSYWFLYKIMTLCIYVQRFLAITMKFYHNWNKWWAFSYDTHWNRNLLHITGAYIYTQECPTRPDWSTLLSYRHSKAAASESEAKPVWKLNFASHEFWSLLFVVHPWDYSERVYMRYKSSHRVAEQQQNIK